jgi:hypothetical protein
MNWRNPKHNVAGTIDCEIQHPVFGWIPFTANRDDTEAQFDVSAMLDEIEAAGNIAAYDGPDAATIARNNMAPLSRRQVFIMLNAKGFLTEEEAESAAAGNAVPATIAATFDALVATGTWTAAERAAARITFLSFTLAYRTEPMVPLLVAGEDPPPSEEQLDTWWQTYAAV